MKTSRDARDFVTQVIRAGANTSEFDIDAIVGEMHTVAGTWDFENDLDDETFWSIIEKHAC